MSAEAGWRILVTGGSGFIGTNLIEGLLALGVGQVVNLDASPPRCSEHAPLWRRCDLLDATGLEAVARDTRPTHVLHLAARTDLHGSTSRDYAANTEGTRNVLQALEGLSAPPRLVVASSRMVCRIGYRPRAADDYCPPNAYGASKVQTERILSGSGYGGGWSVVRPTSIWGPWFGVPYRDFFLAVARGRYRHPGEARIRKSFGYVENTVAQLVGLLRAERSEVDGLVGYLADYEPIEVLDLARRVAAAAGAPPVRSVPMPLLRVAAAGGDVLKRLGWREPPLTRFRLDNLLTEMLHDLEPVRHVVPTLPTSLDVAVRQTVDWMRSDGLL